MSEILLWTLPLTEDPATMVSQQLAKRHGTAKPDIDSKSIVRLRGVSWGRDGADNSWRD